MTSIDLWPQLTPDLTFDLDFRKECEKRKQFCKKNKIEFKEPKFKRKGGYIPVGAIAKTAFMNKIGNGMIKHVECEII